MVWLKTEDALLLALASLFKHRKMSFWTSICSFLPGKTELECNRRLEELNGMHYAPSQREWSTEDDQNLETFSYLIPGQWQQISSGIGDCSPTECKKRLQELLGLGTAGEGLNMDGGGDDDVDVVPEGELPTIQNHDDKDDNDDDVVPKGEEVDMNGGDNDDISSKGQEVGMMYAGEARDQDPFPMQEDNTNVMHSDSGGPDIEEERPTIQNHDDKDFTKLFSHISSGKEMRILMIGLDAAGKTTILYKLKLGEIVTTVPTIGFNVETLDYKNISLTVWDVGAQDKVQPFWRQYLENTKGIIFVVDSHDRQRIMEAKNELHLLLNKDELRDVVVVIFANKQDLLNAMVADEIGEKLGLCSLRQRHCFIRPTCATSGSGLYEGLVLLSESIANKEAPQNVRG